MANAASGIALILAGLCALLFTRTLGPQPRRWQFVYLSFVITGIPTVWYHGFGEAHVPWIFDVGTNYMVAWAFQVAILGDFYSRLVQWAVGGLGALFNLGLTLWMLVDPPGAHLRLPVIGLPASQLLLLFDTLLVIALGVPKRRLLPTRIMPMLYVVLGAAVTGFILALQGGHEAAFGVLSYHSTWHLVASFGSLVVWAINHLRFSDRT